MDSTVLTPAQRLDPERLLNAASAETGLNDFGDESFRDGLQRFLWSAANESPLNEVGVAAIEVMTRGLLVNRLRFAADLQRHPEIGEQPLAPPLVIMGLPRTGTTKLHRMIAVDERFQAIRAWQTLNPAPFPQPLAEDGQDPRIAVAKQMDLIVEATNPEILAGHPIRAEEVDEESSHLMEMSFEWILLAMRAELPSFQAWVEQTPATATYQYLRQLLQYLQWQNGGQSERPYVLKSVLHPAYLDTLLEVFPGATVVHCHREPSDAVASFMRLTELSRGLIYDHVDRHAVGRWVLKVLADQMRRYVEHRDRLGERANVVDVAFTTIVEDAPAVIRQAYAHRGWTLSDDTLAAMLQWEKGHPKDRFGVFTYDLADYGLTRDDVNAAFLDYTVRFDAYL